MTPDPMVGVAARLSQYERTHVPAHLLAPILREYVDRYQKATGVERGWSESITPGQFCERERGTWNTTGALRYESAIRVLATEAGIKEDTLLKYLRGARQWVDFNIADRLLCAMGAVHLWWVEPLASVYWNLEFKEKECARTGCSRIVVPAKFSPKSGPRAKKFCSTACRIAEAAA